MTDAVSGSPLQPADLRLSSEKDVASDLFEKALRRSLRPLVTADIIKEHQQKPFGPHSRDLAAVLNYFRSSAIVGKLAILALDALGPYRIVTLSGSRGVAPTWATEETYDTVAQAEHAVFLMRIDALVSKS